MALHSITIAVLGHGPGTVVGARDERRARPTVLLPLSFEELSAAMIARMLCALEGGRYIFSVFTLQKRTSLTIRILAGRRSARGWP